MGHSLGHRDPQDTSASFHGLMGSILGSSVAVSVSLWGIFLFGKTRKTSSPERFEWEVSMSLNVNLLKFIYLCSAISFLNPIQHFWCFGSVKRGLAACWESHHVTQNCNLQGADAGIALFQMVARCCKEKWISLSTKSKRLNLLYTCVSDCTIYDYYEWQFTSVYPLSIGLAKRNLYQSHQQNQQSNHNCQRFNIFQYSTFALDFGIGFKPIMLICWLDLHNQT